MRKLVIWTVLVLMLVSTLAVMPDEVEAQGPGNKDITFYLHNVTAGAQVGSITTMRIMNTTQGDTLNVSTRSAKSVQYDFYLYPVLADNTTVDNNVTVHIWARRIATSGDNRGAAFIMRLYDVDATGADVATIASANVNYDMLTAWREYTISATNVADYTVAVGHSLRLYIEIDGSSSNDYQMAWGDTTRKSRVDIEMSDYVRVNDVDTLDYQRTPKIVYSQLTANKTMYFAANITDPYGGYDVKWVNATVVAPNGTTVVNEALMTKTQGFFNSYYNEYEYVWNYSGYPTGQYNLTVNVVDNTGYYYRFPTNPGDATFGGHLESMTVNFWIGGMPHNVTINVTDDLGTALPGAQVKMGEGMGTTDTGGQVVLRLANGTYDLEVKWQNVVVYLSSHTVLNDTWIDVSAAVYSPEIIILDDVGDPVFDAVVFTLHPNGTFLDQSWRTDAQGSIDWDTMAGGDYRMSVLWMGVEVYNATLDLNGQGPFTLTVMVYQLDIQVVDTAGQGLELAQVVISNTTNGLVADSTLTDFNGETMSKVPIGNFDFVVYWRNTVVFDSLVDHKVDASGTLILQARIYAVNLTVVDASDLPLANARVVVGFALSGQVQDFGTTDAAGILGTRLPVGYYNFWVYWKDVLVNETTNFYFDGSTEHTILASVYWVDVHVQDTENVSVVSALVTLRHGDGLDFGTVSTDVDGNTSYRLPIGEYRILVSWKETLVFDALRTIDSQDPLVLTVAIYYMRLHVVDSRDVAVDNALVATHNDTSGAIVGSSVTDDQGNITHRVPMGTYRVQIVWQEAVVFQADRVVDHNDWVTIVVNVFYVDIHVEDTMGAALDGALISFINDTTGRSMGVQGTGDDGNVSYRSPIGEYRLRVVWQEALVHESLEVVTADHALNIVASVYYAFVEVVDTTDEPLTGASVTVTNPVTGRIMGSSTTDAGGKVTYRLPMDNYTFEVIWQETVVYLDAHVVDNNDPMVLVATVYYGELHVVDSTGVALESALVTFTNASSGRLMDERTTPESGVVTFRLPKGEYEVEIEWQEAVVFFAVHTLNDNEPWTVVCNVYYAELHVMDSTDVALESALVTFINASSGRLMGERATPTDGIVTFRLPMGEYEVTVVWQETIVWHAVRQLENNDPWTVRCNVFYGELHIIDSKDLPVETALVSLTNATSGRAMGDRTTGSDGVVVYRLPMGIYSVQVIWKDTNVFDDYITIDSNDPHDVVVDVYYPTFVVIDSREAPLVGALVTMAKWSNGRIMGSQLTDDAGSTEFRMPKDTYTVSIVWLDTMVHRDEYGVGSNQVYTVDAFVYYVQFTAVDSRDIGLEWAQIGITNSTSGRTMASHTADPMGWTEFRLPIGVYDVEVLWQHAVVHTQTWTVDDDKDWTISAWVYYVTFHVFDGGTIDGVKVDLAGASVAVANDTASTSLGPINTDAYGNAEFRLPLGDVALEVVWKSTVVFSQDVLPVTADATEEIQAWVYYINVKVKDSTGAKLKGADVHISQNGVAAESATTPRNGIVVFRLPYGNYWVNMSYTTTYYLTPIDVDKSENVDLMNSSLEVKFNLGDDDYPIPFYKTNLFWVILVIVLLILAIVFLIYKMRQAPVVDEPVTGTDDEAGDEGLEDLLNDLDEEGAGGSIAAGAVVEEYSDDDLEDVSTEEPEEYSDDDLEETPEEEETSEEEEETSEEEEEEEASEEEEEEEASDEEEETSEEEEEEEKDGY
jgi:hypothetical protein